ncbi:hypothetical protein [Pseudoneobacillus rhizosphaerae]|uniref:Uncharacterized protein n=1 Tax=Pseudoneobacillus rhizosphaerae TaxID=2880968 RepID=A0A9C7LA51_9BACI|nr:hypothetical protein [Pseudoneobacillus rhizosphaerae]CAG9608761.1 hypothetical protein NEOCIP111885_02478 [Pseudoneobacillus rhizosphaerae]
MKKKTVMIRPRFYTESPYARELINDLEDDSYGLVFNEFLHEMGAMLEVDIIYNQQNKTQWIHADNRHMQIVLSKMDNTGDLLEFIPKTIEGEQLISKMAEEIIKINGEYLDII